MPSIRRIASNLLWTPQGVVRNPLVEMAADGRLLSVVECPAPDRSPFTEFYAGLLVPDFPADYRRAFAAMLALPEIPLPEQLRALPQSSIGVTVVVSGLDYTAMLLTPQSQIRKI